jgi:hypothetical protein
MRQNIPTEFSNTVRRVKARALVSADHPQFSEFPAQETPYPYTQFCQYAKYNSGDGTSRVYQFSAAAGDNAIYQTDFVLTSGGGLLNRPFALQGLSFPVGTPLNENLRALSACDGAVYCASNGKVYKQSGPNAWTLLVDLTDLTTAIIPYISLQAISPTLVVAAAVYQSNKVYDHCELYVIENGVADAWKGYLPKSATKPGLAAFQQADGTIYIYVDDWSGTKPVYLKRFAAKIWGATKRILPTDGLDEESLFKVGYVSTFPNGRVFVTGTLQRQYGSAYSVYMLGPENFTFGRDLIIANSTQPFLLAWSENQVWAVGKDDVYVASAAASIFTDGFLATPTTLDLHNFSLDSASNQGDRLSAEFPGHYLAEHPTDLVPGARLDLQVSANESEYYTVGHFGIDRIRKMEGEQGDSYQLDCTSHALKKLLDWQSDTYFDYLGQSEVHGDPGDLTKLVRFSGGKYETPEGGGLQLTSLNDDGMLYTTPSASHGGFIRCKFTNVQTANAMFGLGLGYGEETMAEAAARLGKKVEQVAGEERGRWALFAIYIADPYGGTAGKGKLCLYDYNTIRRGNLEDPTVLNPWRLIQSVEVDRPAAGGTACLAMQAQDGYARVYYQNLDTPDLLLKISTTAIFDWEVNKSEHENYGRGAIYLRNNTGAHMSYPMTSDCDVIPLSSSLEKYQKYGVPIEDRTDKFPPSNGTVVIDSERIVYTGIAGWSDNRRTLDLDWVPGKVICRAGDGVNPPAGTDTSFSTYRGNGRYVNPSTYKCTVHGDNYVVQYLPCAVGDTFTAFRVWLKKVNYPEDSVTLTLNVGNVNTNANAGTLLNTVMATGVMAPGSKITAEGGWVTFILSNDVLVSQETFNLGNAYWIMLRRSRNANHPSSASYFQYKKMSDATVGGSAWHWCEEDDVILHTAGDLAFVAYGKVEGSNREACLAVQYAAGKGLPASDPAQTYFTNCAITISDGPGKNNCYRILRSYRWTSGINDLYLFFIDRGTGNIFDIGTKMRAVPALHGLRRGQVDPANGQPTLAVAHGGQSLVHLPLATYTKNTDFEYFSADEDLTLAEVTEHLARKAGVLAVDLCNRHPGTVDYDDYDHFYLPAISKNVVVSLDIPTLGAQYALADTVSVTFVDEEERDQMLVSVFGGEWMGTVFGYVTISYYDWVYNEETGYWMSYGNDVLHIPFDEAVKGNFRVSLYDGHISVWCGGRLLGAANLGAGLKNWTRYYVASSYEVPTVQVMMPQAGTRVDNFTMDMGKSGAQLLTQLIGEKRVYFRDAENLTLKIYTDREQVEGTYTRAVSRASEQTDIGLATRVLLEGGEVVEVSSAGNLQKFGNFFKTFNFNEINNLDDAQYFADLVLEDMSLNIERVELLGAVDVRLQPNDEFTLTLKDNSTRQVVVDAVSHQMAVGDQEAVYDMRVSGRYRPLE